MRNIFGKYLVMVYCDKGRFKYKVHINVAFCAPPVTNVDSIKSKHKTLKSEDNIEKLFQKYIENSIEDDIEKKNFFC